MGTVMATATANRMTGAKRGRRRRPTIRSGRAALCAGAGAALAIPLALQAASSVLTSKQPALAVRLFPANGLAMEQLAADRMLAGVTDPAELTLAAREHADLAREAVMREALSPRAHAVLALAEADQTRRDDILAAATAINRRDLLMQGLVLERQVALNDFGGSLATLDRLLRVHPEQEEFFFNILYRALREPAALDAFADILDGGSDWHVRFLRRAVVEGDALVNLARLRDRLELEDEEFDRRLIAALAKAGRYDIAHGLYRRASGESADGLTRGVISWDAGYAPFDWRLAKQAELRAQPAASGDVLDVFVRSGHGGILAERIIRPGRNGFAITLEHALTPIDQVRDVRLQLRCEQQDSPFYDERFSPGTNRFVIGGLPAGCGDYVTLSIHARAWSGRSQIRGTIEPLQITSR